MRASGNSTYRTENRSALVWYVSQQKMLRVQHVLHCVLMRKLEMQLNAKESLPYKMFVLHTWKFQRLLTFGNNICPE